MIRACLTATVAAALFAVGALAATGAGPVAKIEVGARSGLVLPAAGSLWTTDFALGWLAATLAAAADGESAALMKDFLDAPTGW